jgi:PAP2 superfamily
MFRFEALAIVFFALIAAAAPFSRGTARRKRTAIGVSGIVVALILVLSRATSADVRGWVAHLYLVSGYWVPALLTPEARATTFEAWLVRSDAAWRRYALGLPRWVEGVLELFYLFCYPAVPLSFAAVWSRGRLADVDRFWLSVLAAGFASYGCLPWLMSRPPRLIQEPLLERHPLASINTVVLRRVSHGLNTFPSGHVAVSIAAALSLLPVWTAGGVMMGMMALGIAAGAVAGRYHYLVDVLLGVAIGVACSVMTNAWI